MRLRSFTCPAIALSIAILPGLRAQEEGAAQPVLVESATPTDPSLPYDFSKGGRLGAQEIPARYLGDPHFLGFASRLHRPPAGEHIDPLLVRRLVEGASAGELAEHTFAYLMFSGWITEASKARVRALGVKLLHYHPNNCWAARIPVDVAVELSQLPELRWVGFAQPDQKLHPMLWRRLDWAHPAERIPIYVNLFESELSARSIRVRGPLPEETTETGTRPGNPQAAGWNWETDGRIQGVLRRLGVDVGRYIEEIHAYEAAATPQAIHTLAAMDSIAFLEWRPDNVGYHDRVIPQMGQDHVRESHPVTTETVGVIDSGFHVYQSGGHRDLYKQGVGWNWWSGGGCGSVWCDEASTGYHGTHVLGTICGTGTVNNALRGTSPYLGGSTTQRIFAVKGYTSQGYQHMRQGYTDGSNNFTPKPVLVSNSWGSDCFRNPQGACLPTPMNWIGSEGGARTADAEVANHNQLYIFAAGNEGGINGTGFTAGTIGVPAVAKNVLAIGMSRDGDRTVAPLGGPGSIVSWSSHGPCGDGRWKPNINAPGCSTESTLGNSQTGYVNQCGTSMSAPAVAGVLATVAERYPEVKQNAALYRAWAMATAVTWEDATASGSWGRLSSSHLNAYGMGRCSAPKAAGGGTLWHRIWDGHTVGSGGILYGLTVFPRTTRLILVMTWDDPPAAAGANPAAVEDIDLYLDQEPFTAGSNTGEYYSVSSIDTVEHIIINNPTPGNYQIKIHPYRNSGTVRTGMMAIQLYDDTSPGGALAATASDTFIKPGESVSVDITASADSYIATNVYLEEGAQSGFALTGTTTTLKDGQILSDRHDANGNFLLGDTLSGSPRTITYEYRESAGSDATRVLSFQGRSDNWGPYNAQATVTVDGTAPGAATSLRSTSHQPNVWSSNPVIDLTWNHAPDNLAGIAGYATQFGQGGPSLPNPVLGLGAVTGHQEIGSSSSSGWTFNLRAVDRCGNWSGGHASCGPYLIDTIEPDLAANLRSTSHTPGRWSNDPTVDLAWSAATDAHSGLAGYGTLVSDSGPRRPGATIDLGAAATRTTVTLASASYPQYFNLRSADVAGNWDTDFASVGPFLIDTQAPSGVALRIDGGNATTTQMQVALAITATDLLSGVADMRLRNDGGTWSPWEPFAASKAWDLSAFGGSNATGTRYVELEVVDRAGNRAGANDRIYLYSPVGYFGNACAGSLGQPSFNVTGIPGLGRTISFTVGNTAAGVGALYMGLSASVWQGIALPIDLGVVGSPGCYLNVSLDMPVYTGAPVPIPVPVPVDPLAAGVPLHFQWLLLGDPSGRFLVTTRGAEVVLAGL